MTPTNGRSVNQSELKTLHQQARKVGFTDSGIQAMLSFLNIEPWSMSPKLYETVLEFVNPYNALKSTTTGGSNGKERPYRYVMATSERSRGETTAYFKGYLDMGVLGQIEIAVFKNNYKRDDKHPDYNIVLSAPKEEKGRREEKNKQYMEFSEPEDDEIPF